MLVIKLELQHGEDVYKIRYTSVKILAWNVLVLGVVNVCVSIFNFV